MKGERGDRDLVESMGDEKKKPREKKTEKKNVNDVCLII